MEVEHLNHPHPLVLIKKEDLHKYYRPHECKICYDNVVYDACYVCDMCNYYIHKECAELADEITNNPFHPSHPLILRSETLGDYYTCESCHREYYSTPWYWCEECDFYMDKGYALMKPITTTFEDQYIQHFTHQHPILLLHNIYHMCWAGPYRLGSEHSRIRKIYIFILFRVIFLNFIQLIMEKKNI